MNHEMILRKAREIRRMEGQGSIEAFGRLYFSHYFQSRPSATHKVLYKRMERVVIERGQKIAIAAPRGFGKTTMITTLYALHGICYGFEKFIVILSATASQAAQILDGIKRELRENEKLLADFPEVAWPHSRPWKETDIRTPNGIRVIALGSGQQIRGRKHGSNRPTLVIADDLETTKTRFSPEMREDLKEWFNQAVLKAGDQQTNYFLLGTLYHPYSLLAEYVEPDLHPLWEPQVYKAIVTWSSHSELWAKWGRIFHGKESYCDMQGRKASTKFYNDNKAIMNDGVELLWPERYTYLELMEQYEDDPVSFNCEMQNEPINPRDCTFNVLEFTYWDDKYPSVDALVHALGSRNVEFFAACDPSLGKDRLRGDFTAIVILIKDTRNNNYYLVTADIARRQPDEIIETILTYQNLYQIAKFGVEANGFQELLLKRVQERAAERGIPFWPEPIKNTTEKLVRIQSLQPLARSDKLIFRRSERQLLNECRVFPGGRYDDGLDALAMAVKLADETISRCPIRFI